MIFWVIAIYTVNINIALAINIYIDSEHHNIGLKQYINSLKQNAIEPKQTEISPRQNNAESKQNKVGAKQYKNAHKEINIRSIEYNIGPTQNLSSLDEVPWLSLQAGDVVNIHYRLQPYRTKIGLSGRGTKQSPIIIRGIKGPDGELPVISGKNATTPINLNGFFNKKYDEGLAVILIKRGSQKYGYKPGFITIENLKIVGAYNGYTFKNRNGQSTHYFDSAGAIWAVLVENLVVRGCEITDNGNGIFVLSKGGPADISRNILIENNRIYGNGTPGSFRQHNIYTQAGNVTFQYNWIGKLRPGALGSTLKDRSAGTTIRYNKIDSAARALDLVDPEDGYMVLTKEPNFHDTYVYGNLILNDTTDKAHAWSSNMIHYGGDTGVLKIYRKGTLHFYNNTVVIKSYLVKAYRMRIFDLSTNEETVELKNNIIFRQGNSNLLLLNTAGVANLKGVNWISKGWKNGRQNYFSGTVNLSDNGVISSDKHCFVDLEGQNFNLDQSSVCVDAGINLAADGIFLDKKYKDIATFVDRKVRGRAIDLGAFE